MAEIFRLPAVSPTMELGTIVAWRIDEGATFASGDVLVEIGTDKATVEAQVYDDGTLLKQLVEVDAEVPVNAPIAIYGAKGDDISALVAQANDELAALKKGASTPSEAKAEAKPRGVATDVAGEEDAAEKQAVQEPAVQPRSAPSPSASRPPPEPAADVTRSWSGKSLPTSFLDPPGDVRAAGVGTGRDGSERVAASPLARKVATDLGVDLRGVQGTGPGGRIVRADVESAPRGGARSVAASREDETLKLTPMRKTIARRLTEVHQTVPTFFLTVALDAAGLVGFKDALREAHPDVKVGVNDVLMLAVARALAAYPRANASFTDKGIVLHGQVDLGFAVALDEGLITPVIRRADTLGLVELASQTRALAGKAREGKLQPGDYEGNTFTVSNLGMFGIEHFTAIVNPPATAILAVGAVEAVPVVRDGAIVAGQRLRVTMTCDHRAIDGAVGARFLQVLRRFVEQPALMLVP